MSLFCGFLNTFLNLSIFLRRKNQETPLSLCALKWSCFWASTSDYFKIKGHQNMSICIRPRLICLLFHFFSHSLNIISQSEQIDEHATGDADLIGSWDNEFNLGEIQCVLQAIFLSWLTQFLFAPYSFRVLYVLLCEALSGTFNPFQYYYNKKRRGWIVEKLKVEKHPRAKLLPRVWGRNCRKLKG